MKMTYHAVSAPCAKVRRQLKDGAALRRQSALRLRIWQPGLGFASPDSDYDVRFLYVHPLEWSCGWIPRDVIELPIDDELDVCGWSGARRWVCERGEPDADRMAGFTGGVSAG
ncbi:MAG: DNA polymerase beta superfamily protein [Enterobacteriaceae bacterium]